MDGFCNQNADLLGYLAGPSLLTVNVGVLECAPASLSPASSSLTHARRMDGFCNQNADLLGYLAGPSLLTVNVGVVECAPASPYTYSSSTHRFPDERIPIEATPLSATSAELGLGLGLGLVRRSVSLNSRVTDIGSYGVRPSRKTWPHTYSGSTVNVSLSANVRDKSRWVTIK
jgi:hypothetical protein